MRQARTRAQFFRWAALVAVTSALRHTSAQESAQDDRPVTIEYIAHACFRVTSPSGKQVLIDPYASRVWLGYDFPPNIRADAVLISHPHYDHDGGESKRLPVPWSSNTLVLRQPGTNQLGDITVVGYAGKHADPWGKEFGQINTIWLLKAGGLRIVHLGDNGPLTEEAFRAIGHVDVLMIPIDSQFHILKADQIAAIRARLSPALLIPMHYRHDDLETSPDKPEQLGGIDDWAKQESGVRYLASHRQAFSVGALPKKPEVVIFKHSPLVKAALNPDAAATAASPKVADLGVVEVTNEGTNRVTSKDGRVFVVRSWILKDQKGTVDGKETVLKGQTIVLMISQEQTDSNGVTRLSQEQNVGAMPGQTVGISDGVVSVSITPQIKK